MWLKRLLELLQLWTFLSQLGAFICRLKKKKKHRIAPKALSEVFSWLHWLWQNVKLWHTMGHQGKRHTSNITKHQKKRPWADPHWLKLHLTKKKFSVYSICHQQKLDPTSLQVISVDIILITFCDFGPMILDPTPDILDIFTLKKRKKKVEIIFLSTKEWVESCLSWDR